MKNPLTMFVTASVYDIVSSVSYCKLNGEIVRASESKENVIDLGKVNKPVPNITKKEKRKMSWLIGDAYTNLYFYEYNYRNRS